MNPGLLGHRHIISLATRGHGRYSHDGFLFKIDVLNPPTSKTMRLIFIDIETTGFHPSLEGRIVEIACVEMLDGKLTGREFHQLLNPEHAIPDAFAEIIEIDDAMVAGKPKFSEITQELIDFIGNGTLVSHGADFERAFLSHELSLAGLDDQRLADPGSWIDTLAYFKEKHPGERCTLDAACEMYGIDITNQHTHSTHVLQEAKKTSALWQKIAPNYKHTEEKT